MLNLLIVCVGLSGVAAAGGEPIVDSDFAKGDFAALGWKVNGAWDLLAYPTRSRRDLERS